MRQLDKINQENYSDLENQLKQRYDEQKAKKSSGGPPRNRSKEVKTQFGIPFIHTLLTAWHSEEITLHKATKLLDLKKTSDFLVMDDRL